MHRHQTVWQLKGSLAESNTKNGTDDTGRCQKGPHNPICAESQQWHRKILVECDIGVSRQRCEESSGIGVGCDLQDGDLGGLMQERPMIEPPEIARHSMADLHHRAVDPDGQACNQPIDSCTSIALLSRERLDQHRVLLLWQLTKHTLWKA